MTISYIYRYKINNQDLNPGLWGYLTSRTPSLTCNMFSSRLEATITQMLHGAEILTYSSPKNDPNVGKHIPYIISIWVV